jgi:hypothetical protein
MVGAVVVSAVVVSAVVVSAVAEAWARALAKQSERGEGWVMA